MLNENTRPIREGQRRQGAGPNTRLVENQHPNRRLVVDDWFSMNQVDPEPYADLPPQIKEAMQEIDNQGRAVRRKPGRPPKVRD